MRVIRLNINYNHISSSEYKIINIKVRKMNKIILLLLKLIINLWDGIIFILKHNNVSLYLNLTNY